VVIARLLPMGERAFLVETRELADVLALHAALEASRPGGVTDLVPAARTVLVRVDPRVLPVSAARSWAQEAAAAAGSAATGVGPAVELDIAYDGADLAETAELLGLSPEALAARHAAAGWTVAFTGFAPGFGYLVSEDWPFDVPRLASPRTRVPAGAVGLAGGFTGAYPRETPGGWRLIGTTDATLFDPDAAAPALLAPGARVRFRPVPAAVRQNRRRNADEAGVPGHDRRISPPFSTGFEVIEPGLLSTLQDLGRPGAAALGVSGSGALDRTALRTANRLVGNAESAAGIEVTMGGLRAVAGRDLWFAVTGAWGPIRLDGREVDPYEAHAWPAGAELHVDWFTHGARAYLAVRGGLDGRAALGSRSADLLAGLGPAALRAGDVVGVRDEAAAPIPVAPPAQWGAPHDDELILELAPGPRADWFAPRATATLFDAVWTVSNQADRVGARLDGPELERSRTDELPSEGMVPGALQVPPSGRPTVLLADGPVTGGYPVIAVVTDASLDRIAQAIPGTRIRFRHARGSE
jgi:KipI family sensor histidine kinase inhibitor